MKKGLSAHLFEKSIRLVSITLLIGSFFSLLLAPYHIESAPLPPLSRATASAATTLPLIYSFNSAGTLIEASTASLSSSPYFWLAGGAKLPMDGSVGKTIQGALPTSDPWNAVYAAKYAVSSDGGAHPQNLFLMFTRLSVQNVSTQIYMKRVADNLSNTTNRHPYDGQMLLARYKDTNNYYIGGLRVDGNIVIKKKSSGVFKTLAIKPFFSGTYSASSNPNLIPRNTWIGLKFVVTDTGGAPQLSLYTDVGQTGTWKLALSVLDDPATFGSAISGAGVAGIETDYADVQFDNFRLEEVADATVQEATTRYDAVVGAHHPVMYLTMAGAGGTREQDMSGNGNVGTYKGGTATKTTLPNGDTAAVFNGGGQYLTVSSSPELSIPATGKLTWEAWIRPDTLQFPHSTGGYIDWMGKCARYSPTCEWEARMYNATNPENRPSRLSAYVFNPTAGLGSGADWQPAPGVVKAGEWLHVVAEYDTTTTPSGCSSTYPGSIAIWVNGVKWSMADHLPTGCMSQYKIVPKANTSPVNIGTMALDTWFKGAIGKVAIYTRLLSQSEISEHYKSMTGTSPSGSCGNTCTIP